LRNRATGSKNTGAEASGGALKPGSPGSSRLCRETGSIRAKCYDSGFVEKLAGSHPAAGGPIETQCAAFRGLVLRPDFSGGA